MPSHLDPNRQAKCSAPLRHAHSEYRKLSPLAAHCCPRFTALCEGLTRRSPLVALADDTRLRAGSLSGRA